jgi:hypothetical protein
LLFQAGAPVTQSLTAADLATFERFGVSQDLLEAAGVVRVADVEARNDYGITATGDMSGILFPYFLPSSNGQRATCRLRRDHPEIEAGKPKNKYVSAYGDIRHLYFPPGARELLADANTSIVFVESEKAALATRAWSVRAGRSLLPIGTGGCHGWRGRIGKTIDATGERVDEVGPLPDLQCVEGRKITILFDSNTATNPKVEAARFAFAAALRKLKAAEVLTLNLPMSEGVNGPDDFIAIHGDEAMAKILDSAETGNWLELFHPPSDFLTVKPLSFAIEGFLQAEGATMIGGLSGHMKSFTMLSTAKALLAGEGTKLWDLFRVNETAERVIYLIPESALSPFAHRLRLMGLLDHTQNGRLLVRTLNMGPAPSLKDPRLLTAAKGAHVFLDTAMRFTNGDENEASDVSQGLAADLFALIGAGARTTTGAHHSPKSFARENQMGLENILRGSGDLGAMLCTCWAIKLIDTTQNIVHIENVKPRDFQPCGPFQIIGRPYIDETGDFKLHKRPGECGSLDEETIVSNQANEKRHKEADDRVTIVRTWLAEDVNMSGLEMVARFKAMGIDAGESSVRRYRAIARKGDPC